MANQYHLKLIARHGACLYFTQDRSPARYSEVAADQVEQRTGNKTFCFSVNGIKTESQFMDRGPRRPLQVCTVPNDYATLQTNNAKTIYLNTNLVNIYYG